MIIRLNIIRFFNQIFFCKCDLNLTTHQKDRNFSLRWVKIKNLIRQRSKLNVWVQQIQKLWLKLTPRTASTIVSLLYSKDLFDSCIQGVPAQVYLLQKPKAKFKRLLYLEAWEQTFCSIGPTKRKTQVVKKLA